MTKKRKPKRKPATQPAAPTQSFEAGRRRIWLRNVPMLLGLFVTYFATIGPIRTNVPLGEMDMRTSISYVGVGIMGMIASLMVYRRYLAARVAGDDDLNSNRWFNVGSEFSIYLLGGIGIGMIAMGVYIAYLLTTVN